MTDKQILTTLFNIKWMCRHRMFKTDTYGEPVINPCTGCKFYTVKADHQEKMHCQLSALFGNLSANPYSWQIAKLKEIADEE